MKDRIRKNLELLEENLGRFNAHALQFVDVREIKALISTWRWFVSHGHFNPKGPQPEGIASKPPMSWLSGQLQGQTTPLSKDLGLCVAPVPESSLMTEHAARRIMSRLRAIFGYVTAEDAKADQEATYKRKVTDKLSRAQATQWERDRRAREKAKKDELTPAQREKIAEKYRKNKDRQRRESREAAAAREKAAIEKHQAETERLKRVGNKT